MYKKLTRYSKVTTLVKTYISIALIIVIQFALTYGFFEWQSNDYEFIGWLLVVAPLLFLIAQGPMIWLVLSAIKDKDNKTKARNKAMIVVYGVIGYVFPVGAMIAIIIRG